MFKQRTTRRRHIRLLAIADSLVLGRPAEEPTTAEVMALAFARLQLHLSETEAAEYLNAALVSRGRSPRLPDEATPHSH